MGKWSGQPKGLRAAIFLFRPLLLLLTRTDWQGVESLPRGTGYVLAPNHLSHTDPFTLGHALVENGIVPRYLTKDVLFDAPVLGWMAKNSGQIPVYRGTESAAESLRAAIAAVNEGKPIIVYPEGTITRDPDHWPMTGRTGAVRIALATGKPLIPLIQWGPNELLAPYSKKLHIGRRTMIHVRVGEPLDLSEFEGKPVTEELLAAATNKLMDTLTDMVAEFRGTRPINPRVDVRALQKSKTNYRPES